jgi:hypothetical protein
MLITCAAVGVLLNISMQTDLHPRLSAVSAGLRPLEPVQHGAAGRS